MVQTTAIGRLASDFTLQLKRAAEPLVTDWCSGARTIRVGSELEVRVNTYTHAQMYSACDTD